MPRRLSVVSLIDLHTHSTASDGTDTPSELVVKAWSAGVGTIALTDHDTTAGWAEAGQAMRDGMTLVPGAEISCVYRPEPDVAIPMHLLAYLFDPSDVALSSTLDATCVTREDRAHIMVERMTRDGLPVHWQDVAALAAGGTIGRPHIARALVEAGVVPSVDAAFADVISSRSPYYVANRDIPVFDAIGMVSAAGGVCVFAHPLRRGRHVGDEGIAAMAASGLRGIEVDHPDHTDADRMHLAGLARDLHLVATGSSDYHGTNKSTPVAACTTSQDAFEELVDPVRERLLIA